MAAKRASQKAREAKKLVVVGSVLRLHSTDLKYDSKTKRFLILFSLPKKQFIAKLYFDTNCPCVPYQVPFEPNGRQYLDNISYLDCSEIYEDNYSRIVSEVVKNPQACIGKMSDSDFEMVRKQIRIAKTIPYDLKEKCKINEN